MANVTADRVLETSTTTGDGDYTLAGAVTGFRTVASVALRLDTFDYFAEGVGPDGAPSGDWEVGIGTMTANGSIARTTIHASSNNDEAVDWAPGTRRIGLGVSATHYAELVTLSEIEPYILPAVQAAVGNNSDFVGVYQLST